MRNSLVKQMRKDKGVPNPGRKNGGVLKNTIEHVKAEPWEDPQRRPSKPEGERR